MFSDKWLGVFIVLGVVLAQVGVVAAGPVADCYTPIKGGWHIRITADKSVTRLAPDSRIGVVSPNTDARMDRRPLYPPADRRMIWSGDQLVKMDRYTFRPLVVAYNAPRFLFDYHSAGGLLGHLFIGLTSNGKSKWFHEWSELDDSYIDGRMEYVLRDPDFPGVTVALTATPLAGSVGVLVKARVTGVKSASSLVWAYGGASAFFTNWAMNAPEFTFSPKQCAKNTVRWDGSFTLTRGFEATDSIMEQIFAAPKYIPDWKAVIQGGMSWKGRTGFGAPTAFSESPAKLSESTDWVGTGQEKTDCVAVGEALIVGGKSEGYVVVGMGGDIKTAIADPPAAMKSALARNQDIVGRLVLHTPDPYLNAAAPMMAYQTESTWGDAAMVHGGWSWRFAYLGWRIWYAPDCYGWTDRVKKSIQNHIRLNLTKDGPDKGGMGSTLEYGPGVYYNMNEVFFDHVRHYFDYTNDIDLMREIFPTLEGVIEWENRRLRPESDYLYESALNTWVSDQHWYVKAQCTQASAYMLCANEFMADLAKRLGKDPKPFRERADRIRHALQSKLWMPRAGVFAECLDTLGSRMLHTEPELATIYHSAEFGAADPLQIYQMLSWADTHLRVEHTPGGGKQYWSSNWFPNYARSYTHSTMEMAYGEEMNFAQTNYIAGRADEAYAIIRSTLCGIYNTPDPGGLSCHAYTNGTQRANDEFADASSMWGRAVVEGLYGIAPKRPWGIVELTPQFPSDWPEASISTPHFSYKWRRAGDTQRIEWKSPVAASVHLRLALRAKSIGQVRVDGQPAEYSVEPGVGLTWAMVNTPKGRAGSIEITFAPNDTKAPGALTVKQGEQITLNTRSLGGRSYLDPQGLLGDVKLANEKLSATAAGEPGPGTFFLSAGSTSCPYWIPVSLRIEPKQPVAQKVWVHPQIPDRDLSRWSIVDVSSTFNTSVPEALDLVFAAAKAPELPYSQVGFEYWKYHITRVAIADWPSDKAWRERIGADGIGWTSEGIPFKSPKEGKNIGVVTLVGGFPSSVEFPVNSSGKTLYLMISGITFQAQSHVTNLRVKLHYDDNTEQSEDLVNPFTIGDCWGPYGFHDTPANGFENLGERKGPQGSAGADLTKPVGTDTEAHLVAFNLKPGATLKTVRMEAVANDVVFGVMGASVAK